MIIVRIEENKQMEQLQHLIIQIINLNKFSGFSSYSVNLCVCHAYSKIVPRYRQRKHCLIKVQCLHMAYHSIITVPTVAKYFIMPYLHKTCLNHCSEEQIRSRVTTACYCKELSTVHYLNNLMLTHCYESSDLPI
jgi:hypothetical protein